MSYESDDYSWEQVYGLMRCTTKFEQNDKLELDGDFNFFDY
jgi:hypothetical protein